ncbi:mitochondrial intermembrane space import and assembly protein 40-like [Trifolium pratense]|uniref:Mitochondrial intermembrane space import and assembly protein 40 homolog n=1 Tax=Trifolium pratense TaxID=57577 RepID=A0A2K3LN93_TRIPR|nr:mitochondrial intermembrane space import and assembly protein 40 homolog [Trifolium pratense]PNX80011.1 mitochondrial intermembrane space import and assembly protein 40-like [Trifolium pratense]
MGQTESVEAQTVTTTEVDSNSNSSNPTSLESVIAEAQAYGNQNTENIDEMLQKALDCPCIADLKNAGCGAQFSDAFLCFLKSTSEEKGSECVNPFIALQNCIKANPNAFSKDIQGEDESKESEPVQEYKIIPPDWSKESQKPARL